MKKFKLFSSMVLSLTMATAIKAQFDYVKPDDLDQFHSRTLVVIVEKPDDIINEKLNKKHKKDQVDTYKNAIDALNKNFADAIAQNWKMSGGEVEYKSLDEVNDIADKKNYAVLFCRTVGQDDLSTSYQAKNGIMWWPDFKEVAHDKDFSGKITVLGMALLDKFNKTPFYQCPMPDIYPTKEDFKYALNVVNNYLTYRINHRNESPKKIDEQMLQENQPTLKDKTLLLRRDQLDKKLTKAQIDKLYPFPYLVAGKDTVDKAIDDGDTKYAVAMVVPCDISVATNGGFDYAEYVYNIEDGAILASCGIPDMPSDPKNANATNASANKPIITKKALLDFCMYNKDSDESDSGDSKKKGRK
jgi:hypothetical protein